MIQSTSEMCSMTGSRSESQGNRESSSQSYVLQSHRNQNLGKQLLKACINHAIHHKADVIWCNARIKAVPFYKREGFKIIGDEFDIPNIGPHYLMAKNLGIHSGKKRFFELVKHLLADNRPIPVTRS